MDLYVLLYIFTVSEVQRERRYCRIKKTHSDIMCQRPIFVYFYSAPPLFSGIINTAPHFYWVVFLPILHVYRIDTNCHVLIPPFQSWSELTDPEVGPD